MTWHDDMRLLSRSDAHRLQQRIRDLEARVERERERANREAKRAELAEDHARTAWRVSWPTGGRQP